MKRPAFIEQMLMWIMIFISLIGIFFFIIDYSNILRVKETVDTITNYGVRMKAIGRTEEQLVEGMNRLNKIFQPIQLADINCYYMGTTEHQVVFEVTTDFTNKVMTDGKQIKSYSTAFNEVTEDDVTCQLTLRMK